MQKGVTFVNIYVPNTGASKYIKQILTDLKGEIDSKTKMIGYFNTLLSSMARSSTQKISEETLYLNNTLDQINLTDIYRTVLLKAAEYTLFSIAHVTFSRISHTLD